MNTLVESIAFIVAEQRKRSFEPCVFIRTSIAPPHFATMLGDALLRSLGDEFEIDVCRSSEPDAVLRRNQLSERRRLFLVLWDESDLGHAANAASLSATAADLGAEGLVSQRDTLPAERRVTARIRELAHTETIKTDWSNLWGHWFKTLRENVKAGVIELEQYLSYLDHLGSCQAAGIVELQQEWGAALRMVGAFRFAEWSDLSLEYAKDGSLKNLQTACAKVTQELRLIFETIRNKDGLEAKLSRGARVKLGTGLEGARAEKHLAGFLESGNVADLLAVPWAVDVKTSPYGLRYALVGQAKKVKTSETALKSTVDLLAFVEQAAVESEYNAKVNQPEYQSWIWSFLRHCESSVVSRDEIFAQLKLAAIDLGSVNHEQIERLIDQADRVSVVRELMSFWKPKEARVVAQRCSRLLEGLAELLVDRGRPDERATLTLRAVVDGDDFSCTLEAGLSSVDLSARLQGWVTEIQTTLSQAGDQESSEIDDIDRGLQSDGIVVDVIKKRTLLGRLLWVPESLAWDDVACPTVPSFFGMPSRQRAISLPQSVQDAWSRFSIESTACFGAPLGDGAIGWVREWYSWVERAHFKSPSERKLELIDQMLGASPEQLQVLMAELVQLNPGGAADTSAMAPGVVQEAAVALLQCCSLEAEDEFVDLLRSHPLVVELRLAREQFLLEGVCLWVEGNQGVWFEEFSEWVDAGMDESDFPAPAASYCVGPERVLTFASWTEGGAARYRVDGHREGVDFGLRQCAIMIRDFYEDQSLSEREHEFVGDRMRINFGGDADGHWCLSVLGRIVASSVRQNRRFLVSAGLLRAPLSGVFDPFLAARHIELASALVGGDRSGPDVELGGAEIGDAHLVVERGDCVGFAYLDLGIAADLSIEASHPSDSTKYGRLLFPVDAEYLNEGERIIEFSRPVEQRAVSLHKLLGRVSGRQPTQPMFRFHGDLVAEPIRKIHLNGRWVYLVSPFRAHLAVEQAANRESGTSGSSIALVDFWTSQSSKGQVFECLSTVRERQSLTAFAPRELAGRVDMFGLLSVARIVAPRQARRLLSARLKPDEVSKQVVGLVGLALTHQFFATRHPERVYLSLDQHRGLLRGHSGLRADLLEVREDGGKILLRVIESKASADSRFAPAASASAGRKQIVETTERLAPMEAEHFMSARARQRLALALTDFAFASRGSKCVKRLIEAVQAGSKIEVSAPCEGEVHIWPLVDESAQNAVDPGLAGAEPRQPRTEAHGFRETEELLARFTVA